MSTPAATITAERLRRFALSCDVLVWAPALEAAAERFGIDTPIRRAHWLGQLHHESDGFTRLAENLNYKTPARLDMLFSKVRGEADAAALIARGPEAIANRVYAGRNGNGDEASGDGWRFRGRSPIQQTGRAQYLRASAWTGVDLVKEPHRLLEPKIGALAAAGYWAAAKLNDDADRGDVEEITRAINGPALAGLADRIFETKRARQVWR